jgi:hypothetical protein
MHLILLFFAFAANAHFLTGLSRAGIGYSYGTVVNQNNSLVSQYANPPTVWEEFDIPFPVSFHLGVRETWDQNTIVNFNGSGNKRGEIYLSILN